MPLEVVVLVVSTQYYAFLLLISISIRIQSTVFPAHSVAIRQSLLPLPPWRVRPGFSGRAGPPSRRRVLRGSGTRGRLAAWSGRRGAVPGRGGNGCEERLGRILAAGAVSSSGSAEAQDIFTGCSVRLLLTLETIFISGCSIAAALSLSAVSLSFGKEQGAKRDHVPRPSARHKRGIVRPRCADKSSGRCGLCVYAVRRFRPGTVLARPLTRAHSGVSG